MRLASSMFTCEECTQRMYPDDPRIRTGRYNLSGCDYCNKPSIYRELELKQPPQEQVIIHRHSNMGKQEFALLQQLRREVTYLQNKVNEHSGISKRSRFKSYD